MGSVQTGIDWISYTTPFGTNIGEILPQGTDIREAIQPKPYYNVAWELEPAGRLDMNTKVISQGAMVQFTGSDCRILDEEYNGGSEYVMSMISEREHCTFTRIDLATDLFGMAANPDDCFNAFKLGEAKTRVKRIQQIHGYDKELMRDGNTVTIGARSSEVYMRVYSKNLERLRKSGLTIGDDSSEEEAKLVETLRGLDWLRVEFELKQEKASLAAKAIAVEGVSKVVKMTANRFVDFPTVEWWQDMLIALPDAENNLMVGKNHNKGKSDRWLIEQALPAVIKAIAAGNYTVISATEAALKAAYGDGNDDRLF